MDKTILHIDFDSFFASVEQQENLKLRGKPLGITAANGRTAIIAASREAKKMGVKSPSRVYEAKRICPSLITVGANFTHYFEVSKKFIKICRLYSPYLEVFSLDELFLDVTNTIPLFGVVERLIKQLKEQIRVEIGEYITVSVGVSHNKLLAKLGSGLKKPNGVCYITRENLDEIYSNSKLTDICGIGFRIAARLESMGIRMLLDIRKLTFAQLKAEFGPHEAAILQNVAWGRDETPVTHFGHSPEVKSVGRNYALPRNEYNTRLVLQNIFELCEEVCIKLRRLNKKARTVGISLRGSENFHERLTIPNYFDGGKEMFEVCKILLNKDGPCTRTILAEDKYVRQISVWVANVQDANSVPFSLFDINQKQEKLIKIVDTLNEKFGDHTIRNGFLLKSPKLTTVPNGFLADKWERTELAKLY